MGKIGLFSLSITCVMSFLMTLLLPGGLLASSVCILASVMAGYGFWWFSLPVGQYPSISIPRRKAPEPPSLPEHVSWREIDEPLLYGWEYRFRQSIGPIPDDIEALNVLSREHMTYAKKYNRDAIEIGACDMARYRRSKDRRDEHEREARKFGELYNKEVRKFYLLSPKDPIELPMKYKLPEGGPSNRVHSA